MSPAVPGRAGGSSGRSCIPVPGFARGARQFLTHAVRGREPGRVDRHLGLAFTPQRYVRVDAAIFQLQQIRLVAVARIGQYYRIPNAVAGIQPLERDLLIVIDEMPRLGYLKPVMDGYTMAAGKGVHFWCFAQSISALDSSWGKEHRKTLLHLAEVVQVLGFPRTDAEGAEELSKAIGTATFEGRTESRSGTIAESRIVTANTHWQAGDSRSLVRERLVTPDELMTLGPDRQYVIAAAKDMPRDALHLHHARYWRRRDAEHLADPNPFVLRKQRAAGEQSDGGGRRKGPGSILTVGRRVT